jgi:hypothetical protein
MNLAASLSSNNNIKLADSSNVLTFNQASSSINNINNHNYEEDEAASFEIINNTAETNYNNNLKHLEQEEKIQEKDNNFNLSIRKIDEQNEKTNLENNTNLNFNLMPTNNKDKDSSFAINKSIELAINQTNDDEFNNSNDEIVSVVNDNQNDKASLLQHQSLLDNNFSRSSQFSVRNVGDKKKSRKSKSTTSLIRRLFLCGGSCVSSRNASSLHNEFNLDNPHKNSTHSLTQQPLITNESTKSSKKQIKQQETDGLIKCDDEEHKREDNSIKNVNNEITDKDNNNNNNNNVMTKDEEKTNIHIDKNETKISTPKSFVLPLLKLNDDFITPNTNNEFYYGTLTDSYENASSSNNNELDDDYFIFDENNDTVLNIQEECDKLADLNLNENNKTSSDIEKKEMADDIILDENEDFFEPVYDEEYEDEDETQSPCVVVVEDEYDVDGEDNIEQYFNLSSDKKQDKNKSDNYPSIIATDYEDENSKNNSAKILDMNNNGIPIFSFNDTPDIDIEESKKNLTQSSQDKLDHDSSKLNSKNNLSVTTFYSKFSTANNIITDRGCIVNVRTGSFNLGSPDTNNPNNLLDSKQNHECSSQLLLNQISTTTSNQTNNLFRRDLSSNFSIYDSKSFLDDDSNEQYDGSNVLISLLLLNKKKKNSFCNLNSLSPVQQPKQLQESIAPSNNRKLITQAAIFTDDFDSILNETKKSEPTSLPKFEFDEIDSKKINDKNHLNTLNTANHGSVTQSASINTNLLGATLTLEQQERRSSHDPNIEKLHKTYINNLKMANNDSSEISVSSTTNDSVSNILNSIIKINEPSSSSKSSKKSSFKNKFIGRNRQCYQSIESSKSINSSQDKSEKTSIVNKWLSENSNDSTNMSHEDSNPNLLMTEDIVLKSDEEEMNQTENNTQNNNVIINENNKPILETNDSAIDMRSYGSLSTISKTQTAITAHRTRCNWQSFTKYYNLHFFNSNNQTWSKYQISAMSLEQLMALRKLALIQFSKLIERQHSSMIRYNFVLNLLTPDSKI